MSPRARPDSTGWWWVKSPGVKWRCIEAIMTTWEADSGSYRESILQVLDGCWIRVDRINNGIMDGSEWFPASPPEGGSVMNWQPIETAPKDGTEILVWDGTAMFVAYYSLIVKKWINQKPTEWPEYELKLWHPLPNPPVIKDSLTPALPMDEDLDEPIGPACSRDNPECESCQ